MQIYRDWKMIPENAKGTSAALGNFDGVHLGHMHVINRAQIAGPLSIVTFEPHPRSYFAPDAPNFRLMNAQAKANRLEKNGVEQLFELPFNDDLAQMTAEEFARDVLADGLGLSHVVVGADFCFGKDRSGDVDLLKSLGERFGFEVSVVELITNPEGKPASSTAIRKALSEARPLDAKEMLGHWHRIEGSVGHGDKRGRELGFPTANLPIDGLHAPKFGIYAVLFDVLTGPHKGSYKGAASLGVKPTFGADKPCLETFIFDFSGDIYGEDVSVCLVEYLRPEQKFSSLDALIAQMEKDCVIVRDILQDL